MAEIGRDEAEDAVGLAAALLGKVGDRRRQQQQREAKIGGMTPDVFSFSGRNEV
jgi:hypothetical protein